MKKQSRKKRSLEYIRFKNKLRKFEPVMFLFKITDTLLEEKDIITDVVDYRVKELSVKYKLNLGLVDIVIGSIGYDFLNHLKSVKVKIQRLKHNELKR